MATQLRDLSALPSGLGLLEAEAVEDGFSMVTRLREEWLSGVNRFDGFGERLIGAYLGDRLVGIGGLNRDPYLDNPAIGRLRHIYVLRDVRRSGIGAMLVRSLIEAARGRFEVVRLSTGRAATFYETLGFETIDEPKGTHRIVIR